MPHRRRYAPAAPLAALAALLFCAPQVAQAQRRCVVADLVIAPSEASVRAGENYPFTATAYDAAGNPCETVTLAWTSSASAIATVDANGIAHGVTPGSATITARTGTGARAKSSTAQLTVTPAVNTESAPTAVDRGNTSLIPGYNPVLGRPTGLGYAAFDRQPDGSGPADGLFVDPLMLPMVRGEWRAIDFRAVRGTDGQNAARVPIVFLVEPGGERIIAVDSLGIVTSVGEPGTATVRLTVPGQSRIAAKQVRVEVRADTLRFNRVTFSMTPGTTETLSVFIPAQSRALNNPSLFQFRSSDPSKVRVNPVNPVIEALAPGTARIVAQSSVYPDIIATVNVHRPVASVRLEPADTIRIIPIGGRTRIRAQALGPDGNPVPEAPMTWRSPDTSVVAFDSATGEAVGRRSGIATISVSVPTTGEQAATKLVRVRVVAGGLAIARSRFALGVGDRAALDVTLLDEARAPAGSANEYLSWSVAPDTVLRIENRNEIIALKPGFARLTGRTGWDSTITVDVFVVGDLLVTAQNQGRRDLIMKWNSGQNWSPLTADSAVELQAAWSPNFTRILYTVRGPAVPGSRAQPGVGLFLMNADGSNRVRLTDDSSNARFPSFTPNGTIVYESNRTGRAQVYAGDLRGDSLTNVRILTSATPGANNTAPSVSRDGQRIAYISLRETGPGRPVYGVYQANIDGSDERLKTVAPQGQRLDNPAFSPDGRTIYFLRSEQGRPPAQRVYRIAVDASPTDTAVAVTPAGLFVTSFSVSADGSMLALATLETVQGQQQPLQHVMLFNLANSQAQAIDTTPDERPASPALRPAPQPAAPATPNR